MDIKTDESMETKSPQEIEELRKKRLAYFESFSNQTFQPSVIVKEEPQKVQQDKKDNTRTQLSRSDNEEPQKVLRQARFHKVEDDIKNNSPSEKDQVERFQHEKDTNFDRDLSENIEYQNMDEFRKIRERIKEKSIHGDEDGYSEEVERLIQLAKKEISARSGGKNDSYRGYLSVAMDEKGDHSDSDKNHSQKDYVTLQNSQNTFSHSDKSSFNVVSQFVQNDLNTVKLKEKEKNLPTSKEAHESHQKLFIDKLKPQKVEDKNVEDLFTGRQQFRGQSDLGQHSVKQSASESHNFESLAAFQKSIDTGVIEDLGLSTHRAESERLDSDFSHTFDEKKIEEKLKEVSPRLFNDTASDELRFALGEKKYKEFLEKSLKDIDDLNSSRSSDRSHGSKELNKRRASYKAELEGQEKSTSSKVEKKRSEKNRSNSDIPREISLHEKSLRQNDVDSEFTKVTERPDDLSAVIPSKGETLQTDHDDVSNRPLLNRPKHEPKNIYAPKRQMSENDKESLARNYEQLTVSRNVVFSADEIYNQAFKGHVHPPPDHYSSVPSSQHIQGQGHYMNPMFHSVNYGYGQQFPQSGGQFQQSGGPFVPNTPIYGMPGQSFTGPYGHPQYNSYHHPVGPADIRHPYPMQGQFVHGAGDMGYVPQMSARSNQSFDASDFHKYPQYYNQVVPHPPENKPTPVRQLSHPKNQLYHSQQSTHMEPHPPDSVPSSARVHQQPEFSNYLQQMSKGIPYPPPPENVDLNAYFQYLSSQGYPVPYPKVMPTHAGQQYVTMVPQYTRMESGDYIGEKIKETGGQMMVPHPPAQKKDDASPRRNSRIEKSHAGHDSKLATSKKEMPNVEHDGRRGSSQEVAVLEQDVKNPVQRHVEGIRQFHEQRRLKQEEEELLQRQKKFAKASIDRYFNSLESMYSKNSGQGQSNNAVFDSAGQGHSENEHFDSAEQNVETFGSKTLQEKNEVDGSETLVNTEVTAATSIKPGGITDREEKLGIDLSFVKGEQSGNNKKGSKSNGKLVIICPECGEVNKPYMSWCADCGDVLIGIDPILMKKGKNGELKRCVAENHEVKLENIRNVTFVDKDIDGDVNHEVQIITERDDLESPVHDESYKVKNSPNKSDSRDSGRPSSEDMDCGRSEKELNDICENITDPVIKGFIKAYFNRKKQAISMKEGKNSSASEKDENENLQNDEEFIQNQAITEHFAQSQNQISLEHFAQNQNQISSNTVEHGVAQNQMDSANSGGPIDRGILNSGVAESNITEPVKQRKSRSKKKSKNNAPVDIEIFPSTEKRSSSRGELVVPMLDLVNSSDEDSSNGRQGRFLDSSAESNDWNELFKSQKEVQVTEGTQQNNESDQQPFLAQVISENKASKPKRPSSGSNRGNRGGSRNVNSVVRESIESQGHQRHWARSSIAWSSYNQGELSTKSSLRGRPSSGGSRGRFARSGSMDTVPQQQDQINGTSSDRGPVKKKKQLNRPASADVRRPRVTSPQKQNRRLSELGNEGSSSRNDNADQGEIPTLITSPSEVDQVPDIPGIVDHRLPVEDVEDVQMKAMSKGSNAAPVPCTSHVDSYMKYQEMTPRIREGEISIWLCFPDEIFLHILSYLSQSDLARCAQVCKTFHRIVMDLTLWKYITVKKKHNLDDDSLIQIGRRHPVSLALIQCHGENITARGLRELFRECAEYLRELNFFGCSRGALTGDCILLHASARCRNITHVDASWCNVTDSGIGAISESCNRLESLCINGCQNISDEGLETVIKKHGKSLRVLEMFGCFSVTPKGIRYLGNNCLNLITLNLGQCYKMTDSCITQLSSSLGKVETLDLRGCKNIKDNCMRYVVKNCPRLKTIVLANCPNISDVSILEISTYTTDIRYMDVCGCRKITDTGIRAIANNCQNLRYLDISSSGCSHRSVSMLANFCSQRLETLKINFLSDVTDAVLIKLAKHCKRLKLLHLYGCTSVRLPDKIREINPNLVVEM